MNEEGTICPKCRETKPSAEELWERVGYLGAALNAAEDAFDDILRAAHLADLSTDLAAAADLAAASRERGRARWLAEHTEAHE
jgi:hypothetical protein